MRLSWLPLFRSLFPRPRDLPPDFVGASIALGTGTTTAIPTKTPARPSGDDSPKRAPCAGTCPTASGGGGVGGGGAAAVGDDGVDGGYGDGGAADGGGYDDRLRSVRAFQ